MFMPTRSLATSSTSLLKMISSPIALRQQGPMSDETPVVPETSDEFPAPRHFVLTPVKDGAYHKGLPTITAVYLNCDKWPDGKFLMGMLGVPEMLREAEPSGLAGAIPAAVLLAGERPLPEATEALIGACFLAFGFERVAPAVAAAFGPRIEHATETRIDFKSALQELLARRGARVSYEVIAESGPPHARTFEVAAVVDSERVGEGAGRSKKAAEQAAAERALDRLGD